MQSAAAPRSTSAREQNVKISVPNCSYASRSAPSSPAAQRAAIASSAASRLAGSARTTSPYRTFERRRGWRRRVEKGLARSACIRDVVVSVIGHPPLRIRRRRRMREHDDESGARRTNPAEVHPHGIRFSKWLSKSCPLPQGVPPNDHPIRSTRCGPRRRQLARRRVRRRQQRLQHRRDRRTGRGHHRDDRGAGDDGGRDD